MLHNNPLYVTLASNPLVETGPPFRRTSIRQNPDQWIKDGWRVPWDHIDIDKMGSKYRCYSVTINPHPEKVVDHHNDRKFIHEMYRTFLRMLNNNNYFRNIISVYEYGKKGKKYGRLHYHILLETRFIRKVEEIGYKIFGKPTEKYRYTLKIKPVTVDYGTIEENYVANYRHNIEKVFNYYTKESHNKELCLFASKGVLADNVANQ